MAIEIVTRTIASEANQRLQVLNDAVRRVPDIDPAWTEMVILMRFAFASATTYSPFPRFYFGLMSGNDTPPGSVTPGHFVGIDCDGVDGIGFFSNAYHLNMAPTVIVDGVETRGSEQDCGISRATSSNGVWALKLTKGSPNWTIELYGKAGDISNNTTIAQFAAFCDGGWTGLPAHPISGATVAVDEATNGTLDTIVFSFLGSIDPFEICDIDWVRLA